MTAVRELHKRYGDLVALVGAAFVVSAGRILGFLGTNGAGKTTTMRVIFGLVDPHITALMGGLNLSDTR